MKDKRGKIEVIFRTTTGVCSAIMGLFMCLASAAAESRAEAFGMILAGVFLLLVSAFLAESD
jgi:hypothetical protein